MLRLMIDNRVVTWKELSERADVKREKLKTWSNLIGVNKCLD